ncbi:MAG: divergent PAP2 family protein [Candidatus Paceibacterota bacterium]
MPSYITGVLLNKALIASILAWFVAQTIKAVVLAVKDKKFRFNLYSLPGGFPSSHSATSIALASSVGMISGFDSAVFAVASILAFFIIYDARVIRAAAGKQAQSLNRIIESLDEEAEDVEKVKEVLGHTIFEIITGGLIGIIIAILTVYYF